jgi:hypothetical protein
VGSLVFPSGVVSTRVVYPHLFASELGGHMDVAMAEYLLRDLEAWRSRGVTGLVAFHDLAEVTDYDSEARLRITPWSRQHRGQFRAVHVLVRSQAVAWGIRLLSALTDGLIVAHHQREAFEAALREASPLAQHAG